MSIEAKPVAALADEWPPCDTLREIVRSGHVKLESGEERKLTANISRQNSRALYEIVLRERPKLVVEIGMAQGISTLSILSALSQFGGRLISIDPYVDAPKSRMAAFRNVERAGYADLHQHIQAMSYEALPRLVAEGLSPQMGYIDGAHDFDNVFIDCFYLDKLLSAGGILGFNDAGWPDVFRVVQSLKRRGDYVEIDVGLKPVYTGRNRLVTLARRMLNRPRQDRYFRKLAPGAAQS